MAKIHAVSSQLWQKLPQSMNELLGHKHYLFISESKQEKFDNANTAEYHKDKDFRHQMLSVSIVCTRECVPLDV